MMITGMEVGGVVIVEGLGGAVYAGEDGDWW